MLFLQDAECHGRRLLPLAWKTGEQTPSIRKDSGNEGVMLSVDTVLGWLICAVWLIVFGPSAVFLCCSGLRRRTRRLEGSTERPSISVIVPARNEEGGIESCLRSLLASDYPGLEVIAVDDRSEDATGAIMDRVAAESDRLRVIHVSELREGWLGKTHALHEGARTAMGDLLLFTDGDVVFAAEAISLAVRFMEAAQVDHLCLVPDMIRDSYWESALVSYFGLIFVAGIQPWLAATPFRRAYAGVGAFNLVRREAYEQSGGHAAIRLDVVDDVKLGKLMKKSGFRQEVLMADGLVHVRWQRSAWGVICGLEKNAFASLDYSVGKLVLVTCLFVVLFILPFIMVAVTEGFTQAGWIATLTVLYLSYGISGKLFGAGWRVLPALPVAACGLLLAFWRSAILTLLHGGIRWRETFYPLEQLRRNVL